MQKSVNAVTLRVGMRGLCLRVGVLSRSIAQVMRCFPGCLERPLPCLAALIAAAFVYLGAPLCALAATQAQIIDVAPADGAVLGAGESLYVRIEYETDEPIRLWARPFRHGVQIENAMTNASATYSGAGEALGWFALNEPGGIDEVRIIAASDQPYRTWEIARQPLRAQWSAAPAASASPPGWVADLRAADAQRQRAYVEQRAREPVSGGMVALSAGFMVLVLALGAGGVVLPIRSVRRWSGAWRFAAAVPCVVMAFIVLRIIVDVMIDPTSHNLWPFEVLYAAAASLLYIGVLTLARRFLRA